MPLTTPKIFCQADTTDMYLAIKEIRGLFPEAAVFAVGFSLGGYTLNKYLGQVDSAVYGPGRSQTCSCHTLKVRYLWLILVQKCEDCLALFRGKAGWSRLLRQRV